MIILIAYIATCIEQYRSFLSFVSQPLVCARNDNYSSRDATTISS